MEAVKNLGTYADALIRIPSSEQYIGNIQLVVCNVILETKRAIEELAAAKDDR